MKSTKLMILLVIISVLGLNACDKRKQPTEEKTYTVTWKNYNGQILEEDKDVRKGTIPSYDGITPIKEENEQYAYVFSGWDPQISPVIEDVSYVATFAETEKIPGVYPVFSQDKKVVEYGFYPQNYVSDETLISKLNRLEKELENGWFVYENKYYAKITANTFNGISYNFDDGKPIKNGNIYWFECSPIKWNVLENKNGTYTLLSSLLIDVHNYHNDYSNRTIGDSKIFSNNYKESSIRKWLNNDFFETAFAINNQYISDTNVENGVSTSKETNNQYICENTNDKVFLLSYKDYLKEEYGFDGDDTKKSKTRECKTTDYTRARGAWCNQEDEYMNNGVYWSRTPSNEYYYCAWSVNSGGYLSQYAVDGSDHCVRPCISIEF